MNASAPSEDALHLHRDDYPDTLAFLAAMLGARVSQRVGYWPTDEGAWVDWDLLTTVALLSSTEVGCIHIARGAAVLERQGGAGSLTTEVIELVGRVAP